MSQEKIDLLAGHEKPQLAGIDNEDGSITLLYRDVEGQPSTQTLFEDSLLISAGEVMVVTKPQPEQVQALLLRSAHFIVQALSQDVRFRQAGNAITDELGSVMEALGIHYDGCKCGCKGQI
jgi:hypothetical protein